MTDEEITQAVEQIPDGDVESISFSDDSRGSFLIESEESEQDVDEMDEILESYGYERDGFVAAPELCQQFFKPIESEE